MQLPIGGYGPWLLDDVRLFAFEDVSNLPDPRGGAGPAYGQDHKHTYDHAAGGVTTRRPGVDHRVGDPRSAVPDGEEETCGKCGAGRHESVLKQHAGDSVHQRGVPVQGSVDACNVRLHTPPLRQSPRRPSARTSMIA